MNVTTRSYIVFIDNRFSRGLEFNILRIIPKLCITFLAFIKTNSVLISLAIDHAAT